MDHYQELEKIFTRIKRLDNAISILHWDSAVNLAENSIDSRSNQISEIKTIIYEIYSSPKILDLFDKTQENQLNQFQLANFNLMKKWHLDATIIDNDLSNALIKATAKSEMVWRKAREENNFKDFVPYLEEVVNLTREKGLIKSQKLNCTLYEALADEFEPGFKEDKTDLIFAKLKDFLAGFLPEVIQHQQKYPISELPLVNISQEKQFILAKKLMNLLGFDFTKGRIDLSAHPFCGGFSGDCRITTSFDEKNFISGLMGVLHETGHALYEQNLPKDWLEQPLGSYVGMQIHESQSLIIEMQMARTKEFLSYLIPEINETFDYSPRELNADNLYRIINRVNPSFIRIDADEVTYPLHIMMRYNLEKKLLNRQISVSDLAESFREEMYSNLGIRPNNHQEGCLQDIHWPSGFFGYFPSYSLGAMSATQFYQAFKKDAPKGNFSQIMTWLKDNIHSKGSLYSSNDLIKEVTGEELNTEIYQNYLRKKFIDDYR